MNELDIILDPSKGVDNIISALKNKTVTVPDWEYLAKYYYPDKHEILNDRLNRRDKERSDGRVDKAARISVGLEKLLVNRMSEFMFTIPVNRIYHNIEGNETKQKIANAIEAIYKYAKIDKENKKRGVLYYASCEICTIWYAVEKPNTLYGFDSKYKLKCKTYSPMDGTELYPYFDEYGDMLAMSFQYKKKILDKEVTYFETYTADKHYKWSQDGTGWKVVTDAEPIKLLKIPGVYMNRETSIYEGLSVLREEIEYTVSRNSDVIAYNSAPVLKVVGKMVNDEDKGESRRLFRLENGGDVSYVSWAQSNEAVKNHIDMMMRLFWTQAQMPDISFYNMMNLGNIGYDARQTLLTDAHLKVGDEDGDWIEAFEREGSIIKEFLKMLNVAWAKLIDDVEIEYVITPFIQNDEDAAIDRAMKANGGKPIASQLESIQMAGVSTNPQATLEQIKKEEAEQTQRNLTNIFNEEGM